jgi:hypothetical protein
VRHFCTIFDKNYLYQGLALYNSLRGVESDFKLYVLCMDKCSYKVISDLDYSNFVPVKLQNINTNEVAAIRKKTNYGQFCWVCQPLICEYLLDKHDIDMVTYLEADSMFFSSYEVLFDEMGDKSVTLSPHNYPRDNDQSETAGNFCTQFNAFKNDACGRRVLADWKRLCFMYDKNKPKYYPGQLLLNDWPKKYDCVKVLKNIGAGVAPWNIDSYDFQCEDGKLKVNNFPIIFYHYHSYARHKNGNHDLGNYKLNNNVIRYIYGAYVNSIRQSESVVQDFNRDFKYRRVIKRSIIREVVIIIKRIINRGHSNVFKDCHFSKKREVK